MNNESKTKIIQEVINSIKKYPLTRISTLEVAKKAGKSEAYIFKLFKTKNNLLVESFLYIDTKLTKCLEKNNIKSDLLTFDEILLYSKRIWIQYLDFFVNNKNYCLYYSEFRLSKFYTKDIAGKQYKNYLFFDEVFRYMRDQLNLYSLLSFDLFWTFILDTTLLISKKFSAKEIEYNEKTIDMAFHLIFDGIINMLNKKG